MAFIHYIRKYYFVAGCLLICLGFPFFELTPGLMSAGTILCALPLLAEGKIGRNFKKLLSPPALLIILLWVWLLATGLYSDDKKGWWDICQRKLPLILLPLGMAVMPPLPKKQVWGILFFFNAVMTFFAIASTINYFQHYEEINASLIESKSVPVWPVGEGISHIYFSVLMCFSILNSVYFAWKEKATVIFKNDRLAFGIIAVINFIIIHLLSARTGLVALYGGLGALVVYIVWQNRKRKAVWLLLIALPLLPVLAYFLMPSFQNKILNSIRDVQINRDGGDINHRSFSMRLEAWKTGIDVIEQYPLTGVGIGDADEAMQEQYTQNNTVLWTENRVMPHNQFIENGVGAGIFYILFLAFTVFWPVIKYRQSNLLLICAAVMFFCAMCFESILERQIGVTLFPFVYFLLGYLGKAKIN